MELLLLNTASGLKPCYDDDYDNKKKLKIGETYKAKITLARNIHFHRKYFALINCAWELQSEAVRNHFKENVELFRKTIEISAGHCDMVYHIALKQWVEVPKSISFEKMNEDEFNNLYERVKDVLFCVFLKHIDEYDFLSKLSNF
jgi:hypothetical protein